MVNAGRAGPRSNSRGVASKLSRIKMAVGVNPSHGRFVTKESLQP
jgi:hypothetical protein